MKIETSRITIDIPKAQHKMLKAKAAMLGKSMREIVLEGINTALCNNIPNAETQKVIDEIEKGKGLKKAKNLDDLFEKLGI
jgi:hypothetical protein